MDKKLASRLDSHLTDQPEPEEPKHLLKPLWRLVEGNRFRFPNAPNPKDIAAYKLWSALKLLVCDLEETDEHLNSDGKPYNTHEQATKALKEYESNADALFHNHDNTTVWQLLSTNSHYMRFCTLEYGHVRSFGGYINPNNVHNILTESLYGKTNVIVEQCEFCQGPHDMDEVFTIMDDRGIDYQLCHRCVEQLHREYAAEAAAEQAAEAAAHLAFHFPGSHGPNAGPDPDDERERELEALYWEESAQVPNYRPADHK